MMTGDRRTRRILRHRGLTLLEVIVAMALLATGIAGALGAISACVRSSEAAAGYSRGALFAGQVAAELERSESLESGSLSGTFDDLTAGYSWMADIAPADDQGLYPARITVTWREGRRRYELAVTLRPRPVPTAAEPRDSPGQQGPQEPEGPQEPPAEGGPR
jgi:prepilin-type N-terminal cleavage/methylation domain-containing protein